MNLMLYGECRGKSKWGITYVMEKCISIIRLGGSLDGFHLSLLAM